METILDVKNLSKHFGGIYAVHNVSFKLKYDEVCSVVGPNGAGKTTLINVLTNFYPCDSGKIVFMNRDITKTSEKERIELGIARSFQIPALFENLSSLDNLRLAIFSRTKRSKNFFRDYRKYEDVLREGIELLEMFKIPKERLAKELPQGQRKLLDVAITFALKPKLILLDEPTAGVSTYEKHDVIKKILDVRKETKSTLLIIEHDYEIAAYASRTLVMNNGEIITEGNLNDLMKDTKIKAILMGE